MGSTDGAATTRPRTNETEAKVPVPTALTRRPASSTEFPGGASHGLPLGVSQVVHIGPVGAWSKRYFTPPPRRTKSIWHRPLLPMSARADDRSSPF